MVSLRKILIALGLGSTINVGLLLAAKAVGLFSPEVLVRSTGTPLTVPPVVMATLLPGLGAIAVRWILGRLLGPRPRAQRAFLALAAVLLLVSFVTPSQGILGIRLSEILLLDAMHIVAAIAAVQAAGWATRPTWAFGQVPYADREGILRVAVVTGATSGIGARVAVALARRGFRVLGVGRNASAARAIEAEHPGIRIVLADLGSVRDAQRVATELNAAAGNEQIGIVVHCVGILKPRSRTTSDGVDENFATSFLGRVVLTESLRLAPTFRLVNVGASERGEVPASLRVPLADRNDIGQGMAAHGRAQLANDLWVAALVRQGVAAYGYGPGAVETGIRRELPALVRLLLRPLFSVVTRSPEEAAEDILRLLFDGTLPPGGFASREGLFAHDPFVQDAARQDALLRLVRGIVAEASDTLPAGNPTYA